SPYSLLTLFYFSFLLLLPPPPSTLFPYTTLFRSSPPSLNQSIQQLGSDDVVAPPRIVRKSIREDATMRASLLALLFTATLAAQRSEEHTSELQSRFDLVCRLLLEKKKKKKQNTYH